MTEPTVDEALKWAEMVVRSGRSVDAAFMDRGLSGIQSELGVLAREVRRLREECDFLEMKLRHADQDRDRASAYHSADVLALTKRNAEKVTELEQEISKLLDLLAEWLASDMGDMDAGKLIDATEAALRRHGREA